MGKFHGDTPGLRTTFLHAVAEARGRGHRRVGAQHLVTALSLDGGPGGALLRRHGVTADRIESVLEGVGGEPLNILADREALAVLGIDLDTIHVRANQLFGCGALDPSPSKHRLVPLGWRKAQRRCARMSPAVGAELQAAYRGSLRAALRARHPHHAVEHLATALVDRDPGTRWLLGELGVSQASLLNDLRRLTERMAG